MPRHYVFKKKWKQRLAECFDTVGDFVGVLLRRNFAVKPGEIKKVLVGRIDHMGDALLLRPALYQLRAQRPDLEIHLLTTPENSTLFLLDSFVDKVISFEGHWFQKDISWFVKIRSFFKMLSRVRHGKYDAAIDFRGDVRLNLLFFFSGIPIRMGYGVTGGGWLLTHEKSWAENRHEVARNIDMLAQMAVFADIETVKNTPVHFPSSTEARVKRLIQSMGTLPYAVIHAGAGNPEKEWPWVNFCRLAKQLIESKKIENIILVGTTEEKKRSGEMLLEGIIDLRGQTDLDELAYLLKYAVFFIGNDSGPAHLAAAQSVRIVLISSATNQIEFWHPWSDCMTIVPSKSDSPVSVDHVHAELEKLLVKGVGN